MQNVGAKKKTQKMAAQKERAYRTHWQTEGIPEFMLRLARRQHVKIFEGIAMPKYRHD